MIEGWQSQKLGSLAEFRNGVNFGREDEGTGTPIIKVKDFGDLHHVPIEGLDQLDRNRVRVPSNQFLKSNDILLVRSNGNPALVGRSMIFSGPDDSITFSGFSIRARVNSTRAVPAFIHYWLRSDFARSRFAREGNGTGILNLSQGFLADLDILLPPLPEQRGIAATLGALDDKIELNRKMNATLEAMARALFRDWFVDFGPTRARMEGREPYLSPDLWSLFPDRLDDDGKPEGWKAGTLNDLATLNPESWTARDAPGSVAYVDLANTKWGGIDRVEHYDWADAPSRARRVLREGDTIVGTVRPGNGSFCYVGEDGLTGSTGFAVLRPKNARDRAFVWCAATAAENIGRLAHLADGGAYPAVRPEAVAATGIFIPGAEVLEAFRGIVSGNLSLMEANKAESRTLAQTRDLLLPRLMSGELRVAEAELMVEAAQ